MVSCAASPVVSKASAGALEAMDLWQLPNRINSVPELLKVGRLCSSRACELSHIIGHLCSLRACELSHIIKCERQHLVVFLMSPVGQVWLHILE